MGRFVRRHRVGVAAAALVALTLVGATGVSLQQARRASAEADKATAISLFLQSTLLAAGPSAGAAVRPSELRVVDVLQPAAEQAQAAFPGRPDVRAAVLYTLGQTYHDLGLWAEAEQTSRAALALRDSLHGDAPHPDRIQSVEEVARLDLRLGRDRAAVRGYRRSLAMRTERYGASSVEAAQGLLTYSNVLGATGHTAEAFHTARQALAVAQEAGGERSLEAAYALHALAFLQLQNDQVSQADSALTALIVLARAYYAPDDPALAILLQHHSVARLFLGDIDGMERLNAEALRIREARFDGSHPVLNESRGIRAGVLVERGRFREAEAMIRPMAAAFDAGLDHPDPHERRLTAGILGAALAGQGRTAEAEALLHPSTDWLRQNLGERNGWSRYMAGHLARVYTALGRDADAGIYRALAGRPSAVSP